MLVCCIQGAVTKLAVQLLSECCSLADHWLINFIQKIDPGHIMILNSLVSECLCKLAAQSSRAEFYGCQNLTSTGARMTTATCAIPDRYTLSIWRLQMFKKMSVQSCDMF